MSDVASSNINCNLSGLMSYIPVRLWEDLCHISQLRTSKPGHISSSDLQAWRLPPPYQRPSMWLGQCCLGTQTRGSCGLGESSGPETVLGSWTVTRIGFVMAGGFIRALSGPSAPSHPASTVRTPSALNANQSHLQFVLSQFTESLSWQL